MSEAVAVAAPVYPVARCDTRRQNRRQSRHRQPRATRAAAAATGTGIAATGDNTREESG